MTGKQLKNSILQWAIQGKLVPQDPNDEPASVLLERIRAEKAQLIKEGKIKKDKNESIIYRGDDNSYYEKMPVTGEVKCIDEEIPFEIPKGWEWCRLVEVGKTETGTTPSKSHPEYFGDYIPFLGPANILNSKIVSVTQGLSDIGVDYGRIVPKNTILQVCIGGSIGKCAITDKPVTFNQQINSITPYLCNVEFVHIVLQSEYFRLAIMDKATGTATPIINRGNWETLLFPLPPIKEQERIVANITELTHFLGIYSNKQEELNTLNTNMYQRMKKAILQEAIQGKLVPQLAEECTAQELLEQIKTEKQKLVKEGKLKKSALASSVIFRGEDNKYYENNSSKISCIDDEIPFEIPSSWAWARLDNICSFIHRGKSPKYSSVKKYPVIAQKCNQWSGFSIEKARFIEPNSLSSYKDDYFLQDKDLMWNSTGLGTLGRMAIYYTDLNPYELAVADSHVTIIRPLKQYIAPEFLYYYFASNTVQSVIEEKSDGSTKQKELATKTIQAYLVPLPPLAEQYRIVQQIKSVTSIMSR